MEGGYERLDLGELPPSAAAALVRSRAPDLDDDAVRSVLERGGGHPFLLEELTGNPSPTLQARIVDVVDRLDDPSRDSLVRLALLARPASPDLLGDGVDTLVTAGLVRRSDDVVVLRHDLIGTEVLAVTPDDRQAQLHAELARRLPDDESARHHAAAGEQLLARSAALRAAEQTAAPAQRRPAPPPGGRLPSLPERLVRRV